MAGPEFFFWWSGGGPVGSFVLPSLPETPDGALLWGGDPLSWNGQNLLWE